MKNIMTTAISEKIGERPNSRENTLRDCAWPAGISCINLTGSLYIKKRLFFTKKELIRKDKKGIKCSF